MLALPPSSYQSPVKPHEQPLRYFLVPLKSSISYVVVYMSLLLLYGIAGVVWLGPMHRTGQAFKNLDPNSNMNAVLFYVNLANTPHQKHIIAYSELIPAKRI